MTFSVKQIDKGGYYMKRFKKLTAGFLGVVMALSVCSFTALAADGEIHISDVTALKDAITKQEDGQTWILEDTTYELESTIKITKDITIEGNGAVLKFTEEIYDKTDKSERCGFNIDNGAKVEINDLTIDGNDKIKHCINVFSTTETTEVELNSVIMKDGHEGYGIVNNASKVTVTDIETSRNDWGGINVDNSTSAGSNGAELIVNSATINESNSVKIENQNSKKIEATIKDGTFEGKVLIAENVENAKLNITGGEFKDKVYVDDEDNGSSISITGGTFTTDVSDYIDSNSAFVKDEDGNYVVKEDIAGSEFYIADEENLKLAIANQADGVKWVLTDSFEVNERIKITKNNVTFDGNGNTLTFAKDISDNGDGNNSFIEINDVEGIVIKDINLDGNNKVHHGINIFTHADKTQAELEVDNVVIENCKGYAITNNASKVTVTDLETSGNGWGGINVDNSKNGDDCGAELIINSANIKDSNSVKIENANNKNIDAVIKDGTYAGDVFIADGVENAELRIISGTFAKDVEKYIDKDSHIVKIDGEYVVMDEDEYDDYLDDQRDSGRHSYSLKEGKTERDDEEEEPVVTPEPEEEAGPFSDVGKDNPNYDAIIEVYEKGWMAGIADGVFAPNGTLTRGMAVTILWNRAGQPEPASVAPFLDVTSDAWYAKAVAWAYENGITSGYGDTYGPDDFLTTEQFTRMNDIANGRTPEVYVGGAPNATRGWVAGLLVME